MIKEIPILFSPPMVQAELEGRKTKTRRTTGLDAINENPKDWQFEWAEPFRNLWTFTQKSSVNEQSLRDKTFNQFQAKCPYGKPGDLLWVRETFRTYYQVGKDGYTLFDNEILEYAADNPPLLYLMDGDGAHMYNKDGSEKYVPWRPSIHMRKAAARIWLQVTDIRVERLQDISEEDAKAEGVEELPFGFNIRVGKQYLYTGSTAKESFNLLWNDINGLESWADNPWVWVVSFKVLSTTGKPDLKTIKAIA